MMSTSMIRQLSRQAAARAARDRKQPLLVESDDLVEGDEALLRHVGKMPNLGSYRPKGWKLVNASELLGSTNKCVPIRHDSAEQYHYLEVDKSGWGAPGEPAFTMKQFVEAVRKIGPGYGYGMVEEGQFQVVVGVFKREGA